MAESGVSGIPGLRERKKQRTRATLADAAVELFLRNGYENTTVDQIAAVADVSPRTFSRYFATKDAVILSLIDANLSQGARALREQPAELNHFDALYRAYARFYRRTKDAGPDDLTSDRVVAMTRIIMCSPTLRQAVSEFRPHAVNVALAERMAVDVEDPRLWLVASVWESILKSSQQDLGEHTDWDTVTVDSLIERMERAYTQFIEEAAAVGQPV
ncbi:TetR family transcriptional regulator [Mycolicibacterium thermoresistibile]